MYKLESRIPISNSVEAEEAFGMAYKQGVATALSRSKWASYNLLTG